MRNKYRLEALNISNFLKAEWLCSWAMGDVLLLFTSLAATGLSAVAQEQNHSALAATGLSDSTVSISPD